MDRIEGPILSGADARAQQSACVLMASGFGRRFGGNKLLEPFGGRKLIEWAFEASKPYTGRVTVTRYEEIVCLSEAAGIRAVCHNLPERNDTIRLGLMALGPGYLGYSFFPSDQPLLSEETVSRFLSCAEREPDCIWRLSCQGEPGAPAWFPGEFYEALLQLPEGAGGRYLIRQYPERVRTVEVERPEELMDIDNPEDMEHLRARIAGGYGI